MARGHRRDPAAGVYRMGLKQGVDFRWRDIGADTINLRDSKTRPGAVPLGGLRLHDL